MEAITQEGPQEGPYEVAYRHLHLDSPTMICFGLPSILLAKIEEGWRLMASSGVPQASPAGKFVVSADRLDLGTVALSAVVRG